jgi:hypothetical protein
MGIEPTLPDETMDLLTNSTSHNNKKEKISLLKGDFQQALVSFQHHVDDEGISQLLFHATVLPFRIVTIGCIERSSQRCLLHNTLESSNETQCMKKNSVRTGVGN